MKPKPPVILLRPGRLFIIFDRLVQSAELLPSPPPFFPDASALKLWLRDRVGKCGNSGFVLPLLYKSDTEQITGKTVIWPESGCCQIVLGRPPAQWPSSARALPRPRNAHQSFGSASSAGAKSSTAFSHLRACAQASARLRDAQPLAEPGLDRLGELKRADFPNPSKHPKSDDCAGYQDWSLVGAIALDVVFRRREIILLLIPVSDSGVRDGEPQHAHRFALLLPARLRLLDGFVIIQNRFRKTSASGFRLSAAPGTRVLTAIVR